MEKFKVQGSDSLNPYIFQNDKIHIPYKTQFIYIDGGVQKPGKYEYQSGDFLDDIISIAQNDVNHWNQMSTALSKQMCSEGIGKAEQKFCFKVRKDIYNSKTNKLFRNLVMHKREPVSTWPNKTQRNHARLSSSAKLVRHFLYTFPIN